MALNLIKCSPAIFTDFPTIAFVRRTPRRQIRRRKDEIKLQRAPLSCACRGEKKNLKFYLMAVQLRQGVNQFAQG